MAKDNRTYRERAEYLKAAVAKRRKKVKVMAVEYKGGKCCFCGYSRDIAALEFHHKDGETKEFGFSRRGICRSWERAKKELDKCLLVCANCHRELHSGLLQLPDESQECTPGELRES